MYLQSLKLAQFKNYESASVKFDAELNCFVGSNGVGKTNLLEAVYYLCMGKHHTRVSDQFNIRHEQDYFRIEGTFVHDDGKKDRIVIKRARRKRKVIEHNGVPYERLAEHVGKYPVVIVVPDDNKLVLEGSEIRRRLLDNSLSQIDPVYLNHLLSYNKLLANRNAFLKELDGRVDDRNLLEIYDQQMAPSVAYIHEKRQAFESPFSKWMHQTYAKISSQRESITVRYKSQLNETDWFELMQSRREKDRILHRTTAGLHRDDLIFEQDGHSLRRVASQGQMKSFVLSVKLAQYRLLKEATLRSPILLLDDIFEKLDRHRIQHLMDLVMSSEFGQVFITDTETSRVRALAGVGGKQIKIVDGVLHSEEE